MRIVAWSLVAVCTFCLATCHRVSAQNLQSGAGVQLNNGVPKEVESVTVEQRLGESVPSTIELVDSKGRRIKTARLFDGTMPVLISLNYSNCPMLCNVQLNGLAESLQSLDLKIGKDFRLLSVSIDPKETTQKVRETKSKYLDLVPSQPGAVEDWWFCTAKQSAITSLAKSLGFQYRYDKASGEYYHPAMLAFVSPDGVITRYSLDVAFPNDQLKLAILEAGQGKVGSAVDQFVLWCFSYDPNRNSYVLQAWRLMRMGGLLTIGLLVTALLPYWVGRHRRPSTGTGPNDPTSGPDSTHKTDPPGGPNSPDPSDPSLPSRPAEI